MKKVELLSPAGNMEKLKMVFRYGADAAYLGGKFFNLRALAGNFSNEEIVEAVKYAHSLGKKIYVTLNIIAHNNEIEKVADYAKFLESAGVDAVIVADLGVFKIVRDNTDLEINVSTQASNTNWMSVKVWHEMGAKRIILARELSLKEIREIREKVPDVELEVFIHGAMCMSISGRCLLSNYLTGRDANRGACAQPCRWKYHLVEENRPGEYYPIYEDERGTFIMNSRDLCTIEFIDQILDTGIDSLKIEGRMKGIYYGAIVTKVYREAIDKYYEGNFKYDPKWMEYLNSVSNRKYTKGFFFGNPGAEGQNYDSSSYNKTHEIVAKVLGKSRDGKSILEIRSKIAVGEEVEIIKPVGDPIKIKMPEMIKMRKGQEEGKIEMANPNVIVKVDLDLEEMDILRKKLQK
ncbi:protease [Marinitoga sp. 1135]|uniref:peptidase U32 family protein n=1 Tax=unclassified Marinitoga TaxID=2640159 RepID=UPI00158663F9|nr:MULTISPECIES: U32 family peptidase [unclassified Marinitoga]NUU96409.1 protease [Marinitoga sp. 1135]NUU98330.1 protease [Marinitoga sp. 1138]